MSVRSSSDGHVAVFLAACLALVPAIAVRAQSPSQNIKGPTSPTKVPLENNPAPASSVSIQQQTTGGSSSVLSTTTTINVQGPYSGSTPAGSPASGTLPLTLADALSRGLRYNLGSITQNAAVQQAAGERLSARSQLLPNINGALSEELERLNLRSMGVESPQFPTAVTFNFFDARLARVDQSIFDLVRIENLHSATESLNASIKQARDTRDLVVLAVAGSYLELIATQARVSSAQAQVETSRAIYKQADDRRIAGLAPRIDANRAHVQLQTEEQQLRSLQAEFETRKLQLARLIGLPLGQQFAPAESFAFAPLAALSQDSAMQRAFAQRSDLQAAAAGVRAAEDALKAAHDEHLPNLAITGDYGFAGRTPSNNSSSVYSIYGTLTVPIYEGGRIHADIVQAQAALQLRKSQYDDLRGQIDQEIRQAFINLNAAADQVHVAQSNVDLARETLGEARDRFAAGVTDTVEVVQAEQASVQADDAYIDAVFQHNLAKVALARAVGNAEQILPQLLRKADDRTAP